MCNWTTHKNPFLPLSTYDMLILEMQFVQVWEMSFPFLSILEKLLRTNMDTDTHRSQMHPEDLLRFVHNLFFHASWSSLMFIFLCYLPMCAKKKKAFILLALFSLQLLRFSFCEWFYSAWHKSLANALFNGWERLKVFTSISYCHKTIWVMTIYKPSY